MIKRILGINKLEKNFKTVGASLNRSWEWINHFDKINSHYEERINRLEQSNLHLIELTRELLNKLESSAIEEPSIVEEPVTPVVEKVSIPDKDLFLLQLVHQYAAFDKENAVETNTIFDNLTFKITARGLRKKLNSLVDSGYLRSTKRGNVRYWYLNSGALAKIKKAMKSKE